MAELQVELTIKCVVSDIEEAQDALRNATEGCKRAGWDISEAWMRRMDEPETTDPDRDN